MFKKYIWLLLCALLSSCSISKRLPAGQKIYGGSTIKLDRDPKHIPYAGIPELKEELEATVLPRKNSFIFGFPYRVWVYLAVGEPTKEKGLRVFLRNKLGEQPIYFSQNLLKTNEEVLTNTTHNKGYFKSIVTGKTEVKKFKELPEYTVHLEPRYYIHSLHVDPRSFRYLASDTAEMMNKTLLKVKDPYDLQTILNERARLEDYFQQRGYYLLSEDQFIMRVDTNRGDQTLDMTLRLKSENVAALAKKFYINDIKVITDYGESKVKKDTISQSIQDLEVNGLIISENNRSFKPKVFTESIVVEPGDVYSKTKNATSLSRLINLKNFKYIRNKFEIVDASDSSRLNVYYYISPLPRKSIKASISGLTKSNGLVGTEAGAVWQNRNTFHGAEMLNLEVNGGIDLQFGQKVSANNYSRFALKGELLFPRLIMPFKPTVRDANGVPKTSLTASYELLRQKDYYTQSSFSTSWGYFWRKNAEFEHVIKPVYLNIIKPSNISDNFVQQVLASDNIRDLQRYFTILESRFILGLEYQLNYTPKGAQDRNNTLLFNFGLDVAGNTVSLFGTKTPSAETDSRTFLGIPYDQFVKTDFTTRFYRKFGALTWANRVQAGVGIPYRNSTVLPQFKQYFAGGSNGLRGFQARNIGPGRVSPDDASAVLFGNNATGDIKLEFNTEARYKLNSILEIAGFFDAGNIWMYSSDTFYGPEAQFTKSFMKDLAADVGVGLRFDFTYLVLRGDLAIPIRKPWLQDKPWVLDEIKFTDKNWRQNNLVFNLAIAHPF